jgi:hypothetical protein
MTGCYSLPDTPISSRSNLGVTRKLRVIIEAISTSEEGNAIRFDIYLATA